MNQRGVPDRICFFPNGQVVFTEVKAPTGKLTILQEKVIKELRSLGQAVAVVYTKEDVDLLIKTYSGLKG